MSNEPDNPRIVIICGPTAIGKTTTGIEAAEKFDGQIISADSMQIYRHMHIGTAKPTPSEQGRIVHHLIDIIDPQESFDAAQYSRLARLKIKKLTEKRLIPFIVGGTGLYIKALTRGIFSVGSLKPSVRKHLLAQIEAQGLGHVYDRLQRLDPDAAARIHPNDTYRIVRALEIIETTGNSMTTLQHQHGFKDQPFKTLKIGLRMEREKLYDRINRRVDLMIQEGLLHEVKSLIEMGYTPKLKSMQSIGYRHMVEFIENRLSWEEAVRTLKRDTRRYAKRQMTWFRTDSEINWVEPQNVPDLYPQIEAFLNPL